MGSEKRYFITWNQLLKLKNIINKNQTSFFLKINARKQPLKNTQKKNACNFYLHTILVDLQSIKPEDAKKIHKRPNIEKINKIQK